LEFYRASSLTGHFGKMGGVAEEKDCGCLWSGAGGFKLWEGSDDLVKCLCEEWRLQVSPCEAEFAPPPEVSGKRVKAH
jgi:hypothetical protein